MLPLLGLFCGVYFASHFVLLNSYSSAHKGSGSFQKVFLAAAQKWGKDIKGADKSLAFQHSSMFIIQYPICKACGPHILFSARLQYVARHASLACETQTAL